MVDSALNTVLTDMISPLHWKLIGSCVCGDQSLENMHAYRERAEAKVYSCGRRH